jgi:hypothetical protein
MEGLVEGRIVHFVMPDGEHRPAIVTKVWDRENQSGCSNLNVFTDYTNDWGWNDAEQKALTDAGIKPEEVKHGHFWATSRMYSADPLPGTWHWIEKA